MKEKLCRFCQAVVEGKHSKCRKCFERDDICLVCGKDTEKLALYCDECKAKRDEAFYALLATIDPKELEEMTWEDEEKLFMLADIGMILKKIE